MEGQKRMKEQGAWWRIFSDGASKGNPGPAGAGWLILDEGDRVLSRQKKFLGQATNNEAEYQALLNALEESLALGARRIHVHLDSELLVRQLNGQYQVRNARLAVYFRQARDLLSKFLNYDIIHIPRERNREADQMANQAIRSHRCVEVD